MPFLSALEVVYDDVLYKSTFTLLFFHFVLVILSLIIYDQRMIEGPDNPDKTHCNFATTQLVRHERKGRSGSTRWAGVSKRATDEVVQEHDHKKLKK